MNKIENSAKWSKERFDAELEKGYNDMLNGRVSPWNDIYAKLSDAISEINNGAPVADAEIFNSGISEYQVVCSGPFWKKLPAFSEIGL